MWFCFSRQNRLTVYTCLHNDTRRRKKKINEPQKDRLQDKDLVKSVDVVTSGKPGKPPLPMVNFLRTRVVDSRYCGF